MAGEFLQDMAETGELSKDEYGRLKIWGEFMLIIPSGVFVKLIEDLEKKIGKAEVKNFLQQLGEFQVEAGLKRFQKRYGIERAGKSEILDFTHKLINSLGWGKMETVNLDFEKKTAVIRVHGSTLPEKYRLLYSKKMDRQIDYYLSGIFKKHFSAILEAKMDVKETKCMACGDKFCEFQVKPVVKA